MFREMLKSKIHKATITNTNLDYKGSIGIDKIILKESNILPGEKVQVLNFRTGDRFQTYAIEEISNSGNIILYGPAAHRGNIGDGICILSYFYVQESEAKDVSPSIVYLTVSNKIERKKAYKRIYNH